MLLWFGVILIAAGIACLAIDRRAAHAMYDRVHLPFWRFLNRTTHFAKAGHWLLLAAMLFVAVQILMRGFGIDLALTRMISTCALAFILSLTAGSAILHVVKLVLGRRRPRDEIEMNLYGFVPFSFDLNYNSFPSGHALTIMCVAVIASAVWPGLAVLWFALALWLGLTRALLIAHFLSDVFIGAGIGVITAREVVVHVFPQLMQSWF